MNGTFNLKMAVTSKGRAAIAGRIVSSSYDLILGTGDSTLTLVVGSGDSEMGGIGIPMVVGQKKFDFGFCNPAGLGRMAYLGKGFYKRKFDLRAVGVFPSWDRLVFAVRKDSGIRSLADVKSQRFPLRISTRYLGKYRSTMLAIDEVCKAYGFTLRDIEKWGGKMLPVARPGSLERAEHIDKGQVDAVFDEGIKNWGSRALDSDMKFLPIEESVLKKLERIGMPRGLLTPESFPQLERSNPRFQWLAIVLPPRGSQPNHLCDRQGHRS